MCIRDSFVSEEAAAAGRNAAVYVKGARTAAEGNVVRMNPTDGVRYTVPASIRPDQMDDQLTVRFRVGGVYKNCCVCVYFDDECVSRRKRPVVAPGEMEEVKLEKAKLLELSLIHIYVPRDRRCEGRGRDEKML